MILPDQTLGVLGGGQLGRFFAMAAKTMGYRVVVLDPAPAGPAAALADRHIAAAYDDTAALAALIAECAAVTTEFENVPAASLDHLAAYMPVIPSPAAVAITQDRIQEKDFLHASGLPTAPYAAVRTAADLEAAWARVGAPAILKIARQGYDGKGQVVLQSQAGLQAGFRELGSQACVLESKLALAQELSVIVARNSRGETSHYPVAENVHRGGILHSTRVPAAVDASLTRQASELAEQVIAALAYQGVLAVEMFLTAAGELLINELAPRPHNSGHFSLDACSCSQFEQQVRALCGLPLGDPGLLTPVAMVNLLGDLWQAGPPDWTKVLSQPRAKLWLYGKAAARPGRKMGHINVLAGDAAAALAEADALHRCLQGQ